MFTVGGRGNTAQFPPPSLVAPKAVAVSILTSIRGSGSPASLVNVLPRGKVISIEPPEKVTLNASKADCKIVPIAAPLPPALNVKLVAAAGTLSVWDEAVPPTIPSPKTVVLPPSFELSVIHVPRPVTEAEPVMVIAGFIVTRIWK